MADDKAVVDEDVVKASRGEQRRKRILDGFHDCIIQQGYSKTTLRDVANAAGMSASHLLYYYSGKDALLQQYFDDVSQRIKKRIDSFRSEDPVTQFSLLSNLFFAGRGISNSETGFMLECFGVAVHDPLLHSEKADLDSFCKSYLTELFSKLTSTKGQAQDHAEVAYATLIGLRTAAFFDESLSLPDAHRLFLKVVTRQAGIDTSTDSKDAKV